MSKDKQDNLPRYNLSKLFENRPKNIPEYSYGDERQDIKWLRIKRFELLPFLNQEIKVQGKIKKFATNILYRVPHALLTGVIIEDNVHVTHLWIESESLRLFLLFDTIKFEGIVKFYFKNDHLFCLGIENIKNMKLIKEGNQSV